MKKKAVAKGIYQDAYGYEVRWQSGGRGCQQRFPLDAPLMKLIEFRKRKLREADDVKRATSGSFARDVARFLKTRQQKTCYGSDRSHLKPWLQRFRRQSRFDVVKADVQQAIDEWAPKYSARELRHRVTILKQLYHWLDAGAATPADGVRLPKPSRRKRLPIAASVIATVATNLLHHEQKAGGTRLRDAKTRARFLILALSGQRPIQIMRTDPARDVDLERRIWHVPPAKGDNGTIVWLNTQLVAAWRLFIAVGAQGMYDTRSFSKTLKRNGWPADMRPYQLRRRVGQALRDAGVEFADIQDHLGHSSAQTTRDFYVDPSLERLRVAGEKLDGLFPDAVLALPEPTTRTDRGGKENTPENTGLPSRARVHEKGRSRDHEITKTA
jgi:integrase